MWGLTWNKHVLAVVAAKTMVAGAVSIRPAFRMTQGFALSCELGLVAATATTTADDDDDLLVAFSCYS